MSDERLQIYNHIPAPEYWQNAYDDSDYIAELKDHLRRLEYDGDEIQDELDETAGKQSFNHDYGMYEPFKRLGILMASYVYPDFNYHDPETGFRLDEEKPVISLHLPPVPRQLRNRRSLEQSRAMLAVYMMHNGFYNGLMPPEEIVGITYAKLGRTAARALGFAMITPNPADLPDEFCEMIRDEGVATVGTKNSALLQPAIIYSSSIDFIVDTVDAYKK